MESSTLYYRYNKQIKTNTMTDLLKKGNRVTFSATGETATIAQLRGGSYRIRFDGKQGLGWQPKDWLHYMLNTGKATIVK